MKNILNNKKILIAILSVAIIAILFIALGDKDNKNDPIISKYKGGNVTLSEAQAELNRLSLQNKNPQKIEFNGLNANQKEAIIKEVVLREISYKEAKKRGLDKKDDYKKSVKLFKSEILKQNLYTQIAQNAVTEEAIKNSYDKIIQNIKDKEDFRIRYISLATEKEAQSLYKRLIKRPKSFTYHATKKSLDKEAAKKGGDLGFVLEDLIQADILKQAKSMKKGNIASPIQVNNKWAIIKLEDKRVAEIGKFEEVKDIIARNLSTKALQDFISKEIKNANISISIQ